MTSWLIAGHKTSESNSIDLTKNSEAKLLSRLSVQNDGLINQGIEPDFQDGKTSFRNQVTIFGRVVDENGAAIADALISEEHQFRSVRTDINGYYKIVVRLPKYKLPILNFLRSGFRETKQGIVQEDIMTREDIELNAVLREDKSSISLSGWVGDQLGQPANRQKIELRSSGIGNINHYYYGVYSNEFGEFEFEGIRSNVAYRLIVTPTAGFLRQVIEPIRIDELNGRLRITLVPRVLVNLTGRVLDTSEQPVANFEFKIQNLQSNDSPIGLVTDSSGFFKLDGFPAGEFKMTTGVPDYFRISGSLPDDNEYQNLNFVIDKGSQYLSGWVSDELGAPVNRARVTLDGEVDSLDIQSYSVRTRTTDETGTFDFYNVGELDHVITVYAKGFGKKEVLQSAGNKGNHYQIRLKRQ